jgi:small subunit ribosomal protein S4
MFKTESFLNSLENRVDMVLFRMRLLPTVYAAHQYVDHQGVYINGRFLNVAGYTMKIGDIVNLKKEH